MALSAGAIAHQSLIGHHNDLVSPLDPCTKKKCEAHANTPFLDYDHFRGKESFDFDDENLAASLEIFMNKIYFVGV